MTDLNRIACLCIVLTLLSCKKDNPTTKESEIRDRYYTLENIGWKSRTYLQKADGIGFSATEVPIQYYLLKDMGSDDLVTIDSLYEQNKRERIIEFTFLHEEEKDLLDSTFTKMDYTDAVHYMSFGLQKDFYVVTPQKDTIPCSGVTYERQYKIAPSQKVVLFFSGINPNDKIQLIYEDHLFRKGTLKFQFKDSYTKIAL